jgi:hypothetical protein
MMLLEVSVLCLMTWYNVGMEKLLYLGDVVVWRGAWGTESPKEVIESQSPNYRLAGFHLFYGHLDHSHLN